MFNNTFSRLVIISDSIKNRYNLDDKETYVFEDIVFELIGEEQWCFVGQYCPI